MGAVGAVGAVNDPVEGAGISPAPCSWAWFAYKLYYNYQKLYHNGKLRGLQSYQISEEGIVEDISLFLTFSRIKLCTCIIWSTFMSSKEG